MGPPYIRPEFNEFKLASLGTIKIWPQKQAKGKALLKGLSGSSRDLNPGLPNGRRGLNHWATPTPYVSSWRVWTQLARIKFTNHSLYPDLITRSWKDGKIVSNYSPRFSTVLWIWIKRFDWPAKNINIYGKLECCVNVFIMCLRCVD